MTAAHDIFVVGANHRSSTASLRDRLALDATAVPGFLDELAARGIRQALVLSTCDRIEVQGADAAAASAVATVREVLCRLSGLPRDDVDGQIYALVGDDAVRHLFAVAASLDSQIVGEPQVLGQVKEGHRLARDCRMVGPELDAVLQAAYGAAKRVRSETAIAARPVSIASVAARLARDVQGDLSRRAALLIGLGEMGELVLHHLRAAGLGRHVLTGTSLRVEAQARRAGIAYAPYTRLESAVADADIVVAAQGIGDYAITADLTLAALRRRRQRPLVLFDLGVPADVEPAVNDVEGAFLFTADDLESAALQGRSARETAAREAWGIIDAEVANWLRAGAERDAVPELVLLRQHLDLLRGEVLAAHPGADAAEATRLLVNRMLHAPSRALKGLAAEGALDRPAELRALLRRLFGVGLDGEEDGRP